ncbi:glycosyltransferase family 2 protein [Ferrovum sp. PN-J185]|uniref:glycosyltransferase family 2 protein n=1 Tax=Ferrovum sp. PN-J185 TaxID=1356306 RepID=UPI000791A790|nr:glycosyltransferase family 2 protein [Ferrovum sp. PN-J185]KXW55841.1 undecaprenyl-phosphate 4-deoxy-4-formamido-L-arabinose transferase [Ferrovum sp. PN-J185]
MRNYFYTLQRKYLSLFLRPEDVVVEIDPLSPLLVNRMPGGRVTFRNTAKGTERSKYHSELIQKWQDLDALKIDYIVLGGVIHYERDIQNLLSVVHKKCHLDTRVIITYYNQLWKPLIRLASLLGWREKLPEMNWLAHEDIFNLLTLEDYELVWRDSKILIPFYIPIISNILNRYVAPLPVFRSLCMLNISVARPLIRTNPITNPSVSIVVPARNEAGNIESIIQRTPSMGPDDEIIFIEGNSSDNTWQVIRAVQEKYGNNRHIVIAQQDGKGKGDAVRKGFTLASKDILMILDADMTVSPEDLPKFYKAIKEDKGEFINGCRLVYPMDKKAMRFFNLLGNKFFAKAFSWVIGQNFKDTLCGTKVLTRNNYKRLALHRSYFGEFDPFGDFDLIFGAARMGLKIVELPIRYRERTYGDTNISRWKHGTILLAMLAFAARRIKFI